MSNDTLPEIRFPEFTDEWEQRKLSDEMTDFIVPMRDKPKEFGGNIPWTRIEDIEGKFLNDSLSEQYVTEETIQKMNLKIIPKDSLIVSSSATFGVVAVVTQNLITNQTFIGLVPREKNTLDYWYSFFQSSEARKYMKLQSAGSTIFYIARDSFEKMPISVPKIDEMIKIGEYFSNLDNLITLHHRKLDLLKETKKGFLQKMFPKNGAKVPEIRFPGFTDEWEQVKLKDVATVFDGTHQTPKYTESGVKFVSVENIKTLETEKYISQEAYDSEYSKKQAEKGDVLMTRIGDIGTAKVIETDEPLAYYVTLALLKPNEIDSSFLAWLISSPEVQRNIWKRTLHIAFPKKINLGEINQIEMNVPSLEEQTKIGTFFKQLDDTITLHQRELDVLKETKKGFLQKMFV
ncbi:restriction endonuclease subunit S [Enterococcus faecium]|uniref:restriction endonuclease subunit S n=1 Tax=Enterococcus faecium TaxID=1352 RepID=UPI000F515BF4|nr:restriction endonuclease subunit S [Enterococcus faecium]ROW77643.1 restriction endonuclease subunit S [Enterococcus faecium]